MPTLVIRFPDGSEQERELSGSVTIGRADGNDLILVEGGVSRRHARVFLEGDQVMVEDLGSANGTYVDGERIVAPTALTGRAQLVVGDYELALRAAGGGAPRRRPPAAHVTEVSPEVASRTTGSRPAVKAARATRMMPAVKDPKGEGGQEPAAKRSARRNRPPGPQAEGPSLRGLTGPWMNKLYPLTERLVVGRVPGVDVLIEDDSVSRRHAEVELTADGSATLRDLGSSNGTLVNGVRVASDVTLKPGDLITFGVVEMTYELGESALVEVPKASPDPQALAPADAADLGGPTAPRRRGEDGGRRKRLAVVGAAAVLVILVAAVGLLLPKPPPPNTVEPGGAPSAADQAFELNQHLSECRSYAAAELGNPDWKKAEEACNRALDIEPIHPEANQLIRKIRVEKDCAIHFAEGDRAMQRQREDEAIEHFSRIRPECSYYLRAKPIAERALKPVMEKAADDCRRNLRARQYVPAVENCGRYMKYACQRMKREELAPPLGQELVLTGGRLKPGQWRPRSELYLRFLQVREKVSPGQPAWECPRLPMLEAPAPPPNPLDQVRAELGKRYEEKDLANALVLYHQGKINDANNTLLKFRARDDKAPFHSTADELRKDMALVDQLYKEGQNDLQRDEPERAAEPFREALSLDEKLLKGLTTRTPSFYRYNIQQDMASKALAVGQSYNDRLDTRRACKVWKLAFTFYKGNTDLLKKLSDECTARAATELNNARTCADLSRVDDFAVDGDGMLERREARKVELQCP